MLLFFSSPLSFEIAPIGYLLPYSWSTSISKHHSYSTGGISSVRLTKSGKRAKTDLAITKREKKRSESPYLTQHTMFDTVCTLPLSADVFSQAIHPSEPVVSVGLSTGHVQTFRLPSEESDSEDDGASNSSSRNGKGHIDTMWRTRRHKGSCRSLGFGVDGEMLYSAGTDGLVKAARAETGAVENKIAIPTEKDG